METKEFIIIDLLNEIFNNPEKSENLYIDMKMSIVDGEEIWEPKNIYYDKEKKTDYLQEIEEIP